MVLESLEDKPMAKAHQIELTEEARHQLEQMRDTDAKAYMRERAAAILKIADGMSANQTAKQGLLKPRKCDTVCDWVNRYKADGIKGLYIHSGRGRKPSFSPSAQNDGRS